MELNRYLLYNINPFIGLTIRSRGFFVSLCYQGVSMQTHEKKYLEFFAYYDALLQKEVDRVALMPHLRDSVSQLKTALIMEMMADAARGKSIEQMSRSPAVKIANNTVRFIDGLSSGHWTMNDVGLQTDRYVDENVGCARNLPLGLKLIAGAVLAVGCAIVGLYAGFFLGLYAGAGIATLFGFDTLASIIMGAFVGASYGAPAGLIGASYGSHSFFAKTPVENRVIDLSEAAKESVAASR